MQPTLLAALCLKVCDGWGRSSRRFTNPPRLVLAAAGAAVPPPPPPPMPHCSPCAPIRRSAGCLLVSRGLPPPAAAMAAPAASIPALVRHLRSGRAGDREAAVALASLARQGPATCHAIAAGGGVEALVARLQSGGQGGVAASAAVLGALGRLAGADRAVCQLAGLQAIILAGALPAILRRPRASSVLLQRAAATRLLNSCAGSPKGCTACVAARAAPAAAQLAAQRRRPDTVAACLCGAVFPRQYSRIRRPRCRGGAGSRRRPARANQPAAGQRPFGRQGSWPARSPGARRTAQRTRCCCQPCATAACAACTCHTRSAGCPTCARRHAQPRAPPLRCARLHRHPWPAPLPRLQLGALLQRGLQPLALARAPRRVPAPAGGAGAGGGGQRRGSSLRRRHRPAAPEPRFGTIRLRAHDVMSAPHGLLPQCNSC